MRARIAVPETQAVLEAPALPDRISVPEIPGEAEVPWPAPYDVLQYIELPVEDGVPMESAWHRMAMNLLIETLRFFWRDRSDYYVGGNMFIHFSLEHVRKRDFRGPDFFVVTGIEDGERKRETWTVWEEGGRYPNVIVELLSPSTAEVDTTTKKAVYQDTFRTPDYFCYDPYGQELTGWHLQEGKYRRLEPDEAGRLWSEELGLWLGTWDGKFQGVADTWLRFYDEGGHLVPTEAEAEAAARRAEAEARRAAEARAAQEAAARRAAEARAAQLAAELAQLRAPE